MIQIGIPSELESMFERWSWCWCIPEYLWWTQEEWKCSTTFLQKQRWYCSTYSSTIGNHYKWTVCLFCFYQFYLLVLKFQYQSIFVGFFLQFFYIWLFADFMAKEKET